MLLLFYCPLSIKNENENKKRKESFNNFPCQQLFGRIKWSRENSLCHWMARDKKKTAWNKKQCSTSWNNELSTQIKRIKKKCRTEFEWIWRVNNKKLLLSRHRQIAACFLRSLFFSFASSNFSQTKTMNLSFLFRSFFYYYCSSVVGVVQYLL